MTKAAPEFAIITRSAITITITITTFTQIALYRMVLKLPITEKRKAAAIDCFTAVDGMVYVGAETFVVRAEAAPAHGSCGAVSEHGPWRTSHDGVAHAAIDGQDEVVIMVFPAADDELEAAVATLQARLGGAARVALTPPGLGSAPRALLREVRIGAVAAVGMDKVLAGLAESPMGALAVDVRAGVRNAAREFHNAFASWAVQSAQAEFRPLSTAGIDGSSQIVGVADTGVDTSSCYFADVSGEPVPYNPAANATGASGSSRHRKIVGYFTQNGDGGDSLAGHGTHVAATICGAAAGPESMAAAVAESAKFNGIAAGARLVVEDLLADADQAPAGTVDGGHPDDVGIDPSYWRIENLLARQFSLGARLSCNAWGLAADRSQDMEPGTYGEAARAVDRFVWENPDMLPLFSVGNVAAAQVSSRAAHQISSVATAKNALSIGASFAPRESWALDLSHDAVMLTVAGLEVTAVPGEFGSRVPVPEGVAGSLRLAEPVDGCGVYANAAAFADGSSYALVRRGGCRFVTKAAAAAAAGAIGMVVVSTDERYLIMSGDAPKLALVALLVRASDGNAMVAAADANGGAVAFVASSASDTNVAPSDIAVSLGYKAWNSAAGPSVDARFKPELYAPGYKVFSAAAGPGAAACGAAARFVSGGTSSAVAVATGTAALVRDYFVKGYYPSGAASASGAFSPSAALVKAVLVNGAVPLTMTYSGAGPMVGDVTDGRDYVPLADKVPSFEQGFGRLMASESLPLADGSTRKPFDLYVNDSAAMGESGEVHSMCVRVVAAAKPLRVTLAWTDFPVDMVQRQSLLRNLVNDLDLVVSCFSGHDNTQTTYAGNGRIEASSQGLYWTFDTINNVETVRVPHPGVGTTCKISVVGGSVVLGPQRYALVVSGYFETATCAGTNTCIDGCYGRGLCNDGVCECQSPFKGIDCSLTPQPLSTSGRVVTTEIQANSWAYYSFRVTDLSIPLYVEVRRMSGVGDPDVYINPEELPDFTRAEWFDTVTDNGPTPINHHVIRIDPSELDTNKVYFVGIHAFCCDDTKVAIAAHSSATHSLILSSSAASAGPAVAWQLVLGALVAAAVGIAV
ncbi:uncharacterized protein AMSG_11956 [Thecamonas trahens ATCC 50062]|uniref:Subtilisin n=1 Tax=Thecamonas trahens ATCC 50062 TaxID=461836 RepID=A0A0L0DF58_THETB|nr:hypothetical protein AMSG_11956 [Thecamonas trahens ATCC 50062]KNC49953.1 hypothetical protein AMSG_11956 [Thecamonas trahens ATCC 50062]|eukprot:XP_013757456.1 hypothetical protein AMSG_11956 [Thecamonas trahens ATCC 50062]